MMDALDLVVALFLPWAAGTLCLLALEPDRGSGAVLRSIAYGQLAGIAALTLFMRVASLAGVAWSFRGLASALGVLLAVGAVVAARRRPRTHPPLGPGAAGAAPFAWRWLVVLSGALLLIRFGTLLHEVLLQPLYPWDAWTQWATKAKVWSALHRMAPFISYQQWLAGDPGYVDTASHYPATMPLLQAWMALALRRFDDALVNLPWLAIYVALGLGIYAQLRDLQVGAPWAAFVTYLALSLPILDTHVALAGYADLPVAAVMTLGVLSLMRWERGRGSIDLVHLGLALALLPTLKVPGVVWSAALLLGLLIAAFGRTWGRIAIVAVGIAGASVAIVAILFRGKLVSVAGQAQGDIAEPLLANLFLFDNWHLLWYLLPAAIALGWRDAIRMRGTSATLVAGFLFLWVTFALTRAGNWVADYATVNRAFLHIAPAALVFAAYVFWQWALRAAGTDVRAAHATDRVPTRAAEGAGEPAG
jgi:hypothetical protein